MTITTQKQKKNAKKNSKQMMTIDQRASLAKRMVSSGKWLNHIGSARPAKSIKYKTGQLVRSIDPWKPCDHKLVFVQSVRWPGGGGYLVIDRYGRPFTTTNITK